MKIDIEKRYQYSDFYIYKNFILMLFTWSIHHFIMYQEQIVARKFCSTFSEESNDIVRIATSSISFI